MSTFKLEKTSVNKYCLMIEEEELKGISFKIFSSLENIVRSYENFTLIKQDYNDRKSGWSSQLIKGKLVYKSFKDQEKKQVQNYLEIELTGGYEYYNSSLQYAYNQVSIQLQSDTKEVDTRVVTDLFIKFQSFEEIIQRKCEEIKKFIFSEL